MNTGASAMPGLRGRTADIKSAWDQGAAADARGALDEHPELLADKNAVLDLAYEEYCRHWDAGERPDRDAFVARFPAYQSSLRRLLDAHEALAAHPLLFGGPAVPAAWPRPGDRLGDLTLLRELGQGAFARVYLAAEGSAGDRPVAVKVSLDGAAEARTLGPLSHANVMPVLSAGSEGGLFVVRMPYLGCATLHDVLDRAYRAGGPPARAAAVLEAVAAAAVPGDPAPPCPPPAAVFRRGSYAQAVAHLGAQLADALAAVHARDVCHNDLKPSNVLIDPSGRPLLLDFNLSGPSRLDDARVRGTLPYMAPEQVARLAGRPGVAPDARADLYALGVVLYELLTGTHPFGVPRGLGDKETAAALLARQQAGPPPLRSRNRRVGRRLAGLVEALLAPAPEGRPASAAAVAAALRPLAEGRHQALAWLGGGLAAGLLAFNVWAWSSRTPPAPAAAPTAAPRPDARTCYQRGTEALQQGAWEDAEDQFTQALQDAKNHLGSLLGRGRARIGRGDLDAAFIDLDKARKEYPASGEPLAALTYYYALKGQSDAAFNCWGEVCQKTDAPWAQSPELLTIRAYCLIKKGKLSDAASHLDEALKKKPQLQAALYNRAMLAYMAFMVDRKNLPAQALTDITAAVQQKPSAELLLDAALLHSAAATRADDPNAKKALEYLQGALNAGLSPRRLPGDFKIHPVRLDQDERFPRPRVTPEGPAARPAFRPNLRLCDPLADGTPAAP
jgi:serine/threonine protein kinase